MKKLTLLLVLVTVLVVVTASVSAVHVEAKQQFILVYYDGHMHSTYSDGSGSVDDIKATAQTKGLSVVIITDHCKDLTLAEWEALVADTAAASGENFLALPGFEMTGSDGLFNRDHINAINVVDPFVGDDSAELCPEEVWPSPPNPNGTGAMYPQHLTKWVDYIHSQGGVTIHNHPSGTTLLDYGVKHLEVYNQSHVDDVAYYASQLGYPPEFAWQLGITMNNLALYGERDINMLVPFPGFPDGAPLRLALYLATQTFPPYVGQWLGAPDAPLSSWDELLLAYVDGEVDTPIFGLANSDAHNTGDPDSNVGVAKNGVFVKSLTAREFFKALKAGRSFATTGPSLNLTVNGEWMGDEVNIDDGSAVMNLSVSAENPAAVLVQIDIIKNGVLWQRFTPYTPVYDDTVLDNLVTEDGYYRVEVTAFDLSSGNVTFAWSNPIFVKTTG